MPRRPEPIMLSRLSPYLPSPLLYKMITRRNIYERHLKPKYWQRVVSPIIKFSVSIDSFSPSIFLGSLLSIERAKAPLFLSSSWKIASQKGSWKTN
ncbi:hypothetical protein AVEN_25873-1 [Araneus ventricosus]|uniref:Uncharacterized protein n=1 Tax=Araneus ventricosus TaxID=182803 RepID=A0A4Y2DT50_ARAVE|nr:hypothetical protein AVEN_25873-1 [Araneus ventricosus]